ncbi:hypothetical protein JXA85_08090 [Candidatus Woesearchaeota archaeon]|nr:hypothetical protein [Candidatus Woesearchaeota archaeon]
MGLKRALKKTGLAAILATTLTFGTANFGLNGFLNGIAYPLGGAIVNRIQGRKTTLEDITRNAVAGTAMTPVLQYGWKEMERYVPVKRLPAVYASTGSLEKTVSYVSDNAGDYAARAAIIGGCFVPYNIAAQTIIENTVDRKGLVSLYKKFRHEWWGKTKRAIYRIGPMILANTLAIPVGYNVAFGALVFMTNKIIFSLGRMKKNEKYGKSDDY